MGLGRSVRGARYRARSNQAPSSLPPSSACSGRRDWAGRDCGWLPARRVLSLTWPASAVSHLPMAMDVQSGLLAVVSDQTRPQRRCRCHRRAAGGRSWAGTDHGWYSRRVVILEGLVPWHWPSLVRVQLGRRRSGGSPSPQRGPNSSPHHEGADLNEKGSCMHKQKCRANLLSKMIVDVWMRNRILET